MTLLRVILCFATANAASITSVRSDAQCGILELEQDGILGSDSGMRQPGDAAEVTSTGYMLTICCSSGVVFMRWVTARDGIDRLVSAALLVTQNVYLSRLRSSAAARLSPFRCSTNRRYCR